MPSDHLSTTFAALADLTKEHDGKTILTLRWAQ